MTSSPAFSKLALIFMINLFAQMNTSDAVNIGLVLRVGHKIKNILTNACDVVDGVPELVCEESIGFIEKRIEDGIIEIVGTFCNSSAVKVIDGYVIEPIEKDLFLNFIGKHLQSFKDTCNIAVEKALPKLMKRMKKFLEKKCIAELVEFLPVGKNGKKPDLCAGLPSTIDDLCKRFTNKGCQVMNTVPALSSLIPDCEDNLSELVCDDVISIIEHVVEESISLEPTAPKIVKIIETAVEDVIEEGKNATDSTIPEIVTIIETAVENIFEGDNEYEDRIYNTNNNNNN